MTTICKIILQHIRIIFLANAVGNIRLTAKFDDYQILTEKLKIFKLFIYVFVT
jgi:hypothetical protein